MKKGTMTKRASAILKQAYALSLQFGHPCADTTHLLLAILYAPDTSAGRILLEEGLCPSVAEDALLQRKPRQGKNDMSQELKRTIRCATREARAKQLPVSVEQLLLSTLRSGSGRELLLTCGGDADRAFTKAVEAAKQTEVKKQGRSDSELKLAEQFTQELAEKAALADPVIGRQQELEELIRILCRKNKNNPALIGEPGVGKTALVEELARRMAAGRVPEQLKGKRLLAVDMASLVAGTKYRGEFEERVRDLLAELRRSGNIILFVDEMHTLIGAGSAEGAIDAANIIKPALGRGELQMIGATTFKEYRKYIEKDAALERRFRTVQVKEPTQPETQDILRGLRPGLELHHRVRITDDAIEAAVEYSVRYINDRFLPDKALDLLDESAACAGMEQTCRKVDRQTVAQTVAMRTGIPTGRISISEKTELLRLEKRLSQSVLGQDNAVRITAAAVRRGRSGLADGNRPIAALLFAGPTGVGKTALCKALAREVYGSEQAMIRLDMSEYMEKFSISRLLGAPPGYIGHGEGGELTEKVRLRPYSLLLLDELEKAHRDVTGVLLQILEDGILTDSMGRQVNFKNTLLVMTTNAGSTEGGKSTLGFIGAGTDSFTQKKLQDFFTPELLGRIDAVATFNPLGEKELSGIAELLLLQTVQRAKAAGVHLLIDENAAGCIGAGCLQLPGGARELRHTIQTQVENPLADLLLSDSEVKEVSLLCRNGKLELLPGSYLPV